MNRQHSKFRTGLTLVELMVTGTVAVVLFLAVGVLLDGGNRAWWRAYDTAHGTKRQEATALRAAFGSIGRRANRTSYFLYQFNKGVFQPVAADPTKPDHVVAGDAVEFRYWDVALDKSDSHQVMDVAKLATAYALFYLDGKELKVDYGPYPPGAIPVGGGSRNTTGVTTIVLAEDATARKDVGPFSHTASGGVGRGCVRLNVTLTDPESKETTDVLTGVLLRNIWPR